MSHIASLDSFRVDTPTILYCLGNSWYLELPSLNLKLKGNSPKELRERAQRELSSAASTSFSARLEEVKREVETCSSPEVVLPEASSSKEEPPALSSSPKRKKAS